MKKSILRKIGVISLAVAVSMSMGVSAFAAEGATGVTETNATTFNIDKEIMVYNDDSTTVYGPGITFDYTVAPSAGGAKVTDSNNKSVTVKTGVQGGVGLDKDSKAVFEQNAVVNAAKEGAVINDTITAEVDLSKFTAAGVYRYEIKEARPDAFEPVGLTRPENYDDTRYLDVYIGNTDGGKLQVIGYVLFAEDLDSKTTGFVDAIGSGEATTGHADKYYTYNYSITKMITGTLADKTHAFPFSFTTDGAVKDQKFSVTSESADVLKAGVDNNAAKIGTEVLANLADNQTITIKGLPANTTFNVKESNDSEDVYQVSIVDSAKEEAILDGVEVAVGTDKTMAEANMALTNYAEAKSAQPEAAYTATTFTNTLNDVSPTNVVTRYAPFLFIIAAAILLLAVMRRRKAQDEE